jgi:hypothetical protein
MCENKQTCKKGENKMSKKQKFNEASLMSVKITEAKQIADAKEKQIADAKEKQIADFKADSLKAEIEASKSASSKSASSKSASSKSSKSASSKSAKNSIYDRLTEYKKLSLADRLKLVCYAENELIDKHALNRNMSIVDITNSIKKDKQFKLCFKEKAFNIIAVRNAVNRHDKTDHVKNNIANHIDRVKIITDRQLRVIARSK